MTLFKASTQIVSSRPGKRLRVPDTVLLVDDEEMVVKTVTMMLERLGYCVLSAHDGKEAIEVFRRHGDEISLVVMDVSMPYEEGGDVSWMLKEMKPQVKILICSGLPQEDALARIPAKYRDGFLQKPFRLKDLSLKIDLLFLKQGPPCPIDFA